MTLKDVAQIISKLENSMYEHRNFYQHGPRDSWSVNGNTFAWERPYSKTDLKKLGDAAPGGTVLAVGIENQTRKTHWLEQAGCDAVFTIPHFEGYPAVLVALDQIKASELEPLLHEAWQVATKKKPKRR